MCSLLESTSQKKHPITLEGHLIPRPNGSFELSNATLSLPSQPKIPLSNKILIKIPPSELTLSKRLVLKITPYVQVRGRLSCPHFFKNEAALSDLFWVWREDPWHMTASHLFIPPTQQKAPWYLAFKQQWIEWLKQTSHHQPHLFGLLKAIWTGQTDGLSSDLITLYQKAGMLHILALSGQHVVILARLLLGILFLGYLLYYALTKKHPPYYAALRHTLPILAALTLTLTSLGSSTMLRSCFMILALSYISFRGYSVTAIQVVCSSTACLLLLNPSLVSEPSFFLSVVATLCLTCLLEAFTLREFLKQYLLLSVLMPLIMLPVSAFLFGKITWLSPLYLILFSWVWDLLIIPMGFAFPFLSSILPKQIAIPFANLLNSIWHWASTTQLSLGPWVDKTYISVPRPTWVELYVIQILLFLSLSLLLKKPKFRF